MTANYSTPGAIIGASLAGIATYFLVRTPKGTYDRTRGEYDAVGFGLIAASMVAGGYAGAVVAATPQVVAALPAATPPVPQTVVALQPGTTTIAPAPNSQVAFTLPAGASWPTGGVGVTVDTPTAPANPPAEGVQTATAFTFNATDPKTLYATWVDASGAPQTTTINMYLAAA